MAKLTLLIVDDDAPFRGSMRRVLRTDYSIVEAATPGEALAKWSPPPDVVLLDLRFEAGGEEEQDGLEFLKYLKQNFPEVPVVMATGYADINVAVEAMQIGAADFVQKDKITIPELKTRLARALENSRLTRRIRQLEGELKLVEPRQIVGDSQPMQRIKRVIEAVARDGDMSVLILGETGTGKELVARAIHAWGRRGSAPFVSVMLNALPTSTLEAELFGYEAGAFTDARERRIGYLERAHGGVLFLDEIGEINLDIQVKLLRFLEEREFQRLGSTKSIRLDVQVVAATNADLERRVLDGAFREDLYFRLKVHEIRIPPLRERREDIELLTIHLLKLFRQRGKRISDITPDALRHLCAFDFPGNVRQLRNVIESAIFNAELNHHEKIEIEDLPQEVLMKSRQTGEIELFFDNKEISIYEQLARAELKCVMQALAQTEGKKNEAWKLLGYNDRFVFTRRVRRLFSAYKQLRTEYPDLYRSFADKSRDKK